MMYDDYWAALSIHLELGMPLFKSTSLDRAHLVQDFFFFGTLDLIVEANSTWSIT